MELKIIENDSNLQLIKLNRLKNCRNLVLCGGGSKCICFTGVVKFLSEFNILKKIKRFAGTSAGALMCLLLVLGYTQKELDEEMEKLCNNAIFDVDVNNIQIQHFYKIISNVYFFRGINTGNKMYNFLKMLFNKKGFNENITFHDLAKKTNKKLFVVASNITSKNITVFSHKNTPDVKVIDAIRASTCIPFIFQPVKIDDEEFVDGGMLNNFPLKIFEKYNFRDEITLGIKINTLKNFKDTSVSLYSYVNLLLETLFNNVWNDLDILNNKKIKNNIIIIDIIMNGMNFIDFNIESNKKIKMKNKGYDIIFREFFNLELF